MQPRFIKPVLLVISTITPLSTFADNNTLEPIVVTATRTEQSLSNTLAPVTLITRENIEQSQATSITELLSRQPGLDISSNGGIGTKSSLFTRGTNSNHTLFLVNGIRVGSVSSGSTALQHIPLQQIERIEIIRGPRSSLYGSDAIGGVIQIITRKGSKNTATNLLLSHGTHNTNEVSAGISGSTGSSNFNLQLAHLETDGISALSTSDPDLDGYQNQSINASFHDVVSEKLEIGFNLLITQGDTEYDPFFFSLDKKLAESLNSAVGTDIKLLLSDNWDSSLKFGHSRDEAEQFTNGSSDSFINTESKQFTWQNDVHISDTTLLTLGYDHIDEVVDATTSFAKTSRNNKAAFIQMQKNYTTQDFIFAIRNDNNEAFGHYKTGNIDWRYKLNSDYNITASYGKAFKAPTFNQLYWPDDGFNAGNPNLQPEESYSSEIIVQGKAGNSSWSMSIYKTDITNLIDWTEKNPTNLGKAQVEGIEGVYNAHFNQWDIQFQFDALDPINKDTGEKLIRRSSRNTSLSVDKKFSSISAGITIEGHGSQIDNDSSNWPTIERVKLPGYGLVNLRAKYDVSKHMEIKAKVDNALDESYENVLNFNTPGRTAYLSLSYKIP